MLAHVQLLWELMLLGEPLLVLAPSPAVSSEMVLALTRWAGRPAGGRGPGPAPRAHCPEDPACSPLLPHLPPALSLRGDDPLPPSQPPCQSLQGSPVPATPN